MSSRSCNGNELHAKAGERSTVSSDLSYLARARDIVPFAAITLSPCQLARQTLECARQNAERAAATLIAPNTLSVYLNSIKTLQPEG